MSRDPRRLRGRVAIAGAAEADEHGKLPHKSAFMLHAEAARNALADAGLSLSDVDAVVSAGLWMGSETAEYLGIRPRYIDGTQIGGCSFIAHVQHAMAAIDAGIVDVALITHGESGASRVGMPGTRFGPDAFRMQFENPFGLEATGFCKPGEGGPFVSGGRTAPGGPFPMNTNGGGLSYTHSGMYGMFTLVEAVCQLRGECGARQVSGAKTAICHGLGGMFSAAATLICGSEVPA